MRISIRREHDAAVRSRRRIILHLAKRHTPTDEAAFVHVAPSTLYRLAERFRIRGFPARAAGD